MANRRGKGEGSIFQRADGTWCSTIDTGRTAEGKRLRKTIYGATKKAVTDKLTRFQNQKLDGTLIPDDHTTVEEFIDWWLDNSAATRVRESTLASYRQVCRLHVKPKIGAVKLQKLAPAHVQGLVASMLKDNKSPRLTQMTYTILHRALVVAVKQGMVIRNVADAIDRPTAPKHEIKPVNQSQVAALLAAAETDRLYALYVLALATGCRQGELFALEWDDIDRKAGTLQVRRTLVELNGKLSTNEPKTAKGRRLIPLPQMAIDALWEHKARLMAEGLAGCNLVFPDSDGNYLRRQNVLRRSFTPILKAAKLKNVRFHDLRHASATLMLGAGTHPKIVQERLGHSQIGITMDTYSHCLPSMQQEAADKLDGLLRKKTS